jgi:Ni,Fe-hydrogenase III component G
MMSEEEIKGALYARFPFLADSLRVQRKRRVFVTVAYEHVREILEFAKSTLGLPYLSAITGLDEGQQLGVIYHLSGEAGIVVSIKTGVPADRPIITTVTALFSCAEVYERELVDLFGFVVEGLPPGNRYPLTDDWPVNQYPLRKGWKRASTTGATDA